MNIERKMLKKVIKEYDKKAALEKLKKEQMLKKRMIKLNEKKLYLN